MQQSETKDLGKLFKQYFDIVPAFSEALKEKVYTIRHQVYCEELEFEKIRNDEREIDNYDEHSLHILIRNISTDEYIGCVRIIRPKIGSLRTLLPFEDSCATVLNRSIVDPAILPSHKIAEASRLAVIGKYRRRKGERNAPVSISNQDFDTEKQQRFPYIPVALFLSAFKLSQLYGIDYLFCLTEERLGKHFIKLGFKLKFIGDSIEHRGCRFPSVMDVNATVDGIRPNLYSLYKAISDDIEKALHSERN